MSFIELKYILLLSKLKDFFALITYKYSRIVLALFLKQFTYINSFYWHFIYPFELCNLLWIWSESYLIETVIFCPESFQVLQWAMEELSQRDFLTFKKKKKAGILFPVSVSLFQNSCFKKLSTEFTWNILPSSFRKPQEDLSLSVCLTVKIWTGANTPRRRAVSLETKPIILS